MQAFRGGVGVIYQEQQPEPRFAISARGIRHFTLICAIWYMVRMFMVYTGVMFIYIPYLDDSLRAILQFLTNVDFSYELELLWLRVKYALSG